MDAAWLDPNLPARPDLLLPDRDPRLDRLDPRAARRERLGPVRRRGGHGHGDLADPEEADAVAEGDARLGVFHGEVRGDPGQLLLGHRGVRLVDEMVDRSPVVVVPDDADEEREAAVRIAPDAREERSRVDRGLREKGHASIIRSIRTRTIAVSALKGGVGKTTTAVNLAAAAARAGKRVLLVDVDPQASVSTALGLAPGPGLDEWLRGGAAFADVVREGAREGLDVVPAGGALYDAQEELEEKSKEKRRTRLRRRLAETADREYHAVVLDCPPSVSLLLENAYVAADELLMPAKLDPLSLPALEKTRQLAKRFAEEREKPLRILGVLPTFHDLRTHVSDEVLNEVRERFTRVLTPIRINAALAAAPALGQTIFELDPSSRGAVDYALLAEDLRLA